MSESLPEQSTYLEHDESTEQIEAWTGLYDVIDLGPVELPEDQPDQV